MNPMTDERHRKNIAHWEKQRIAYPYRAQALTLVPSLTEVVSQEPLPPGNFIALPMPGGVTYWGFSKSAGRAEFLRRYPSATELAAEAVFGNPV